MAMALARRGAEAHMADVQTDVQAIIATARSGHAPYSWNVWTLRRDRVLRGAASWAFITIVGLFLFVLDLVVAHDNFNPGHGAWIIVLALTLLTIFGIMGFGGLFLVSADIRRLAQFGEYLLIMTPDDYIKVEPHRVTHVPMDQIDDITLKGVRRSFEGQQDSPGDTFRGLDRLPFLRTMGNFFWRRPKQAASLAFRDLRTNRVVVVGTDDSFDDLFALEQVLQIHVGTKRRSRRRA